MNAAETIQAAINKLTRLQGEATPGVWYPTGLGIATRHTDAAEAGLYVTDPSGYTTPSDREIISTLHATIDAQLYILAHGRAIFYGAFGHEVPPELRDAALVLAQSILGQQVDA